jgi:N-formylglutamate amidohydrolase
MSQNQPDRAFDMAADDRVLTDGDVEAIAEATATRLAEIVSSTPGTFALVDARQLARDLGVSLDYVYAHATELGAMRLGSGPKARIRFDLNRARQHSRPGQAGPTVGAGGRANPLANGRPVMRRCGRLSQSVERTQ